MKTIGVLGAGIMGNGIAQVSAIAGYEVVLYDIDQKFIDRGLQEIKKSLERMVKKSRLSAEEVPTILGRITSTLKLEDFKTSDMIIEAIPENIELKKRTFQCNHNHHIL